MNAVSFDAIGWGTSWTNSYDAAGNVVSTQNLVAGTATSITVPGRVGTEVKWGAAINGCPFTSGAAVYFLTKTLVDVCGNYCQRTYSSSLLACANGTVDGFSPVEVDPPGTAGESAGIYAGGRCG
jgi:hypothetical protein